MSNSNSSYTRYSISIVFISLMLAASMPAKSQSLSDLVQRLDKLEQENRDLRGEIESLKKKSVPVTPLNETTAALATAASVGSNGASSSDQGALVQMNGAYTFAMLDATATGKGKPLHLLTAKRDNQLSQRGLYIGGALNAVADYQTSNFTGDFGLPYAPSRRQPRRQDGFGNRPAFGADSTDGECCSVGLHLC